MIDAFGRSCARAVAYRGRRRALVGRVAGCCAVVYALMPVMFAHAGDIAYGYDALGRLTSVTVAGTTAYYDYDAAGNITAIRRQGALSSAAPLSGAGSLQASAAGQPSASPVATPVSAR